MPLRTVEHRANGDGSLEATYRRWPSSHPLPFTRALYLFDVPMKTFLGVLPEKSSNRIDQVLSDHALLTTAALLRRAEIEAADNAQAEAKAAKRVYERPEPRIGIQYGLVENTTIISISTRIGINEIVLDIPRDAANKTLEEYRPRREASSQPQV